LIARFGGGKVRVRRAANTAWLTVKGPRLDISRSEFEYEIPVADADDILRSLCNGPVVEKVRHIVPYAGFVWAVDVHMGPLAGVAFAEVELRHPDEHLPLPGWVGKEVTYDPRYQKRALLRRWAAATKRKAAATVTTAAEPS
jgi:CYTH domain-containing protein